MVIVGDKDVVLRPVEPSDLDFLVAVENDENHWEVSNTRIPFSLNTLKTYLETPQDIYSDKQIRFIITHKNEPCGFIDLFEFDPFHLRAGIGVVISKSFENKGIATHAIAKMIAFSRLNFGLRLLWCNILENNTASIHLFEKMAFQRMGVKRDWHKLRTGEIINEIFYQLQL